MEDFVHLHVHTQYSLLDGQSGIPKLVDKAIANGMRGVAITDHGNMMGVKELFNYTKKKNGPVKDEIKALQKELAEARKSESPDEAVVAGLQERIADAERRIFKPIFGCEMYVAERSLFDKTKELDSRRYHLIVLAKNLTGYHNLIKLVSQSWIDGFYNRPRT
ncbi:MAG: PHP domain-containing protein, partial [Bacteroidaceae bacterium]|nr:PHP domain-containing protein [Bacteroidaceae bacterium]